MSQLTLLELTFRCDTRAVTLQVPHTSNQLNAASQRHCAHRPEVAHSDGESNCERTRTSEARSDRVARGKHGQHQHEADEQLNAEDLSKRQRSRIDSAQVVVQFGIAEAVEQQRTCQTTQRLHDNVQERTTHTTQERTHTHTHTHNVVWSRP